ncbi:MAG: phage tail protein [Salinivirgaceae bacterium]|nr:MAG: phage tail protein [Salinivirgaceae bacterium]
MTIRFNITSGNNNNAPEPALGFRYRVSISGINDADEMGFSEISGLTSELETEQVFAGGENNFVYNLPKQVKSSPLVLKRGFFNSNSSIAQWINNVLSNGFPGNVEAKDVVIQLINENDDPIISWTLYNTYPTKWEVSGFNAMENKMVVESITLNYSRFELEFN